MEKKLRWGIIGTGGIARKFARGLAESRTGRLVAVGSRAEETLRAFLADFPARGHASYEALLADPEVEAVYISTPHPSHAMWSIRAAQTGKHILCEKPLTMNAVEAAEVIQAARTAGVFLMEAFMYRCHPQTARLLELIRDGSIGAVRLVQAAFSFRAGWNPEGRLLNRALGGGGILDVGGYSVSMARLIAGAAEGAPFADPVEVKGLGQIGGTGVDELAVALLRFPGGMLAQLSAGVRVPLENIVRVWGEEGHIDVPSPWVVRRDAGESVLRVYREGKAVKEVTIRAESGIYAIEADAVAESISAGESPAMSWADSLGNMRTLDRWRAEIGLRYEADGGEFEPRMDADERG
jgi:predicted dehydrogenase